MKKLMLFTVVAIAALIGSSVFSACKKENGIAKTNI